MKTLKFALIPKNSMNFGIIILKLSMFFGIYVIFSYLCAQKNSIHN